MQNGKQYWAYITMQMFNSLYILKLFKIIFKKKKNLARQYNENIWFTYYLQLN